MLRKQLAKIAFLVVALCHLCAMHPALANDAALVYSVGYKLDKSYNESAFRAVVQLRDEGRIIQEFSPRTADQSAPMIEAAAQVADHVVIVGFTHTDNLVKIAPMYPNTHFTIIDSVVKGPANVQSMIFREEEGAFIAGVAAAITTHHNVIGFVGGMYSPAIKRFQAGYEQGAEYISPNIKVISRYIGNDFRAFSDPMSGYLAALHEIQQGADVIFSAAGSSGLGAYQAADETITFAIGVDSDQNHLFPTTMLTSMVKDVGRAVRSAVDNFNTGRWEPQVLSFGLKEGAFYLSLNNYNKLHFPKAALAATKKATEDIIAGRIKVRTLPLYPAPVGAPNLQK